MATSTPSPEFERIVDNLCRRLSLLAPFDPDAIPTSGVFFGADCTIEMTPATDGTPFVLCAKPTSGSVSLDLPTLDLGEGVNVAPLTVDNLVWAYVDSATALTGPPTDQLKTLTSWPSSASLAVDAVPAGGALFATGTLEPSWPPLQSLTRSLGLSVPVTASVVFVGGSQLLTLSTAVGPVPGIFENVTVEIGETPGPSQLGFELRLIGTTADAPLWAPLTALHIAPGEVTLRVDLDNDLSVTALTLDLLDLIPRDQPLTLIPDVLALSDLEGEFSIADPTGECLALASVSGVAELFGSGPLFAFSGSYPDGVYSLALLPGTALDLPGMFTGMGLDAAVASFLPTLTIGEADVTYRTIEGSLYAEFQATCDWSLGPLTIESLSLALQGTAGDYSASLLATAAFSSLQFSVGAAYDGGDWSFTGIANGIATDPGTTIADLLETLDPSGTAIPSFLTDIRIDSLGVSYSDDVTAFNCQLTFDGMVFAVSIDKNSTTGDASYGGTLTLSGGQVFDLTFDETGATETFTAKAQSLDLAALLETLGVDEGGVLPSFVIDPTLIYTKYETGDTTLVFEVDAPGSTLGISVRIARYTPATAPATTAPATTAAWFKLTSSEVDVSQLPVIGSTLSTLFSFDGLRVVAVSGGDLEDALSTLNVALQLAGETEITPADVDELTLFVDLEVDGDTQTLALGKPDASTEDEASTGDAPEGESGESEAAPTDTADENEAAGTEPDDTPADTGESDAPADAPDATPDTTPAVAAASPAPPPAGTWINVQKSLGPLDLRRIGGRYDAGRFWVMLDVSLVLSSFELDLLGLALGFKLQSDPDITANLDGIGVSADADPVEISGGLTKNGDDYAGEISIKAAEWQLTALAAYSTADESFFAYAVLDAQIGGPPIFFITGLAAGVGVNRDLVIPDIDSLPAFPLIAAAQQGASSPLGAATDVGSAIAAIGSAIPVKSGENWLAVGVNFTSFKLVNSFALLVVKFGDDLEIDLLGTSKLTVPPDDPNPIAQAEVALRASYRPDDGVLKVEGRLTPGSYIFSSDFQLTGGFAFYSWMKNLGEASAGDFVFTLGGYHPQFTPPAFYPTVPRLAASWSSGNLSVKGDYYFALTPHAVMGGGSLEATWSGYGVNAWFTAYADFLICWQPFSYDADIGLSLGASYRVDLLFTSFTVSVSVGVDLHIWGPAFGGTASVDLYVCSFDISFGASNTGGLAPIAWADFRKRVLPPTPPPPKGNVPPSPNGTVPPPSPTAGEIEKDSEICGVRVSGGLLKDLTGTDAGVNWVINPEAFELTTFTTIPSTGGVVTRGTPVTLTPGSNAFGVSPVGIPATHLISTHTIVFASTAGMESLKDTSIDIQLTPITQNVPAAAWAGEGTDAAGNIARPSGDTINPPARTVDGMLTGYTITPIRDTVDVLRPIQLAALNFNELPTPTFAWSTAATPTQSDGRFDTLQTQLVAAQDARAQIVDALATAGVISINSLEIDVSQLAHNANLALLSPPVFTS